MPYSNYREYRKAWNSAYKVTPKIPLNIDIELSAVCNLKCPFCPTTQSNYKKPKNKFFPVILLTKIFNEVLKLGIPAIKFNWMGEPTLHPDFNYILEFSNVLRCYDILINTNGNYPPRKNIGLLNATKVFFSLDSMNETTYQKMRKGGELRRVLFNIESLLGGGHKNIYARRVITNDNKDEDFKHYVEGYFDGKVEVSEHYVFDRTETTEEHIYQHKNLKRQYCGYPSQRLVIDTEGNVFPCCVDFHKTMCLGSIEIDSLLDIWNSIKLKTIRDLLKDGYFPTHTCQNCTSWVAYKHPYSENMKDKEIWAHTMKEISSVI